MKITDADIIKSGEKELIDLITADLDWDAIEKIFAERHRLRITDDVQYKDGDIVIHNNQIAYKLDFNVKVTLSLLFDRAGEYLSFNTSADLETPEQTTDYGGATGDSLDVEVEQIVAEDAGAVEISGDEPLVDPYNSPEENISEMASRISGMVSDINAQ